jgi:hypothetical protein
VEPQQRRGYTADRVILDENYDLSTDDDPLSRHQRLLDRMRATVTVVIGDGE